MPNPLQKVYNYTNATKTGGVSTTKKINSIGYGEKLIGIGLLFAAIVPAIVYLIPIPAIKPIRQLLIKGFFILGIIILAGFTIWLMIEFHQDRKLNRYYAENTDRILKVGEDCYECQACGSRKVRPDDERCNVCGTIFTKEDRKKPNIYTRKESL